MVWISGADRSTPGEGGFSSDALFNGANPGTVASAKENKFTYGGRATTYNNPYDATSGVVQSSAEDHAQRFSGMGGRWAGMTGPRADYTQTRQDANMGLGSRILQNDAYYGTQDANELARQFSQGRGLEASRAALGMASEAAAGYGPSVANETLRMGMNNAMQNQLSAAASVRGGPGASAMAARTAMMQGAQAGQQQASQAALLRAQEIAQARGQTIAAANAYDMAKLQGLGHVMGGAAATSSAANAMREGDLRTRAQSAQEAQFQAQMEMAQRGLGAQTELGYERLGHDVRMGQLQAELAADDKSMNRWKAEKDMEARDTDRWWSLIPIRS